METVMDTIVLERVATPAPGKSRLQVGRRHLALASLALAVAMGGIGYSRYWWTVGRFIESTDDAYAGGNVTAVSPHVAGFVAQILVTDNQHVQAGQLLIRLDGRDSRPPSITPRRSPPKSRRHSPGSRRNTCCNWRWSARPRPI